MRFSLHFVVAWWSVNYRQSSAASLMPPVLSMTSKSSHGFRVHEFDTYLRVYEFLTASSSSDEEFNVVDVTPGELRISVPAVVLHGI